MKLSSDRFDHLFVQCRSVKKNPHIKHSIIPFFFFAIYRCGENNNYRPCLFSNKSMLSYQRSVKSVYLVAYYYCISLAVKLIELTYDSITAKKVSFRCLATRDPENIVLPKKRKHHQFGIDLQASAQIIWKQAISDPEYQ